MTKAREIRYSYESVPTLRDFASSDARIRGINGPFRCLPGDTEFLTPRGWRRMDAYCPEDMVAQWTPDATGGVMRFVKPDAYIVDDADEMIEFDCGFGLIMRMTEGHRVPHYNWAGTFQCKTAGEIALRPSKRTVPTTFRGHCGPGIGMTSDMIRFAVMMHADGCYPKVGKRAQIIVRKERKKVRIRQLLSALEIEWRERTYPKRPTETTFTFEAPYVGKHYEGFWWAANQSELAVVLDEMPYWDGLFDNKVSIFSSAHKIDADFIQYAAHANGLRASMAIVEYPDKPNWKPSYRLSIRMGDSHKNRACIREGTRISRIRAPGGKAYCFTVRSGYFIARCDNTVFITGNSGKSSASVMEIVQRGCAQKPGPDGVGRSRWIVVRNTFSQLEDSTIRTTHMWLPPGQFGKYRDRDHTYTINALTGAGGWPCEIEIWFRALDRPDHVRNLLSVEVTGGWVNEAREVPWAIIEALDGRIGQYPAKHMGGPTWMGLWMDTNPPDIDSKWFKFFIEGKHDPKRVMHFQQPSGLSPGAENLANLPSAEYYKDLAYGKSLEWVNVYIHGKFGFVADGKLVYPEYIDPAHCKSVEPVEGYTVYRGWDFGLTPACIFAQDLPDGRFLVFDEMVSDNMSIDQFSDDVLEHCRRSFNGDVRFEDWADPAGEQKSQVDKRTCFDIMRAKGILVEASEQSPTLRQEAVRSALRQNMPGSFEPRFVVHPRCRVLRKGFMGGYHRRRLQVSGSERYSIDPEKNEFSHPHDALQYVAVKKFAGTLRGETPTDDYPRAPDGYGEGRGSEVTGY